MPSALISEARGGPVEQITHTAANMALDTDDDVHFGGRIEELEAIIADDTVGIVQRSKAKVELAHLRGRYKGGGNNDRRGKLSSRPSVRNLGGKHLVAKNRVINEYYIKQNEERVKREEEILQIQKELQDEAAIKSADHRQQLERRLTAAQEAIEALALIEADDEYDSESSALDDDDGGEPESEDSELSRLRKKIASLQKEIDEQELTIEGLNILLEDHEKENDAKARELKDTEKLMQHYKSKAKELEEEVDTLKSSKEDNQAIPALPQIIPKRPSTQSRPSMGGRRLSTLSKRASMNPSFRADLHRAATKGNLNDEMRKEAQLEMKALEEQLAAMDTEKSELMEELATVKAILESSAKDGDGKGKKKRERLVYQLSCKKCNKQMNFVGMTDRDLKSTMERHFDQVVKVACKKSKGKDDEESHAPGEAWSGEFADHFAKHCKPAFKLKSVSEKEVRTFCRQNVKVELLKRSDGAELYWEDTE